MFCYHFSLGKKPTKFVPFSIFPMAGGSDDEDEEDAKEENIKKKDDEEKPKVPAAGSTEKNPVDNSTPKRNEVDSGG